MIFMFAEFLIKKFFQSCSGWYICCSQGSKRSVLWMLSPSSLHRLPTHFDERYKRKQSEPFLSQPEHTICVSRHRILRTQSLHFGCLSLKAVYFSCKVQRLLQVAKFLFMYSFTTLLFMHIPTEIVIFINVCYHMKCFGGNSFSFS